MQFTALDRQLMNILVRHAILGTYYLNLEGLGHIRQGPQTATKQ
jgi:hypothetical protein